MILIGNHEIRFGTKLFTFQIWRCILMHTVVITWHSGHYFGSKFIDMYCHLLSMDLTADNKILEHTILIARVDVK